MTDLSLAAVLSIEKGEESFGGWATAQIPEVGIYKLLAKRKAVGVMGWDCFYAAFCKWEAFAHGALL